jgi:DNA-binding Xre family transcriptional regulator
MINDRSGDRDYQKALIAEIDAVMGRRRISRRELSRLSGIHRVTLDRVFNFERDLNVAQWAAICSALGVDPGETAARASHPSVASLTGDDPRALITCLLNNPDMDGNLNSRLSDAESRSGLRGSQLEALKETIRDVRRRELGEALRHLPPSTEQGGIEAG